MTSLYLIIVESPAKCKKIESFLGSDYKCIASFGHICELNQLDQIDYDKFENNKYQWSKSKYKQIKQLKELTKQYLSHNIFIATDNDREGEAIGFHICRLCHLNPLETKRILFNEISKRVIVSAIENPTRLNLEYYHSQQTRQIMDLVLGYKITPFVWKYITGKGSAGRCQTPALGIVYDNECEVYNKIKKASTCFKITGYFGDKSIQCTLNNPISNLDDCRDFMDKCKNHSFFFNLSLNYESKGARCFPLITTTLQTMASSCLGLSAKQTMSAAQKLYEKGMITYMRTDSTSMSKQFVSTASKYIEEKYGSQYLSLELNKLSWNKNKNKSQDAHECIRCCDVRKSSASGDGIESKLYNMIYTHTLKCMMKPPVYDCKNIEINAPQEYMFLHTLKKNKFAGYDIISNKKEKSHVNLYDYFSTVSRDKTDIPIKYNSISAEQYMNSNLSLLNDTGLVKRLESKGIGRPSTFASIVSNIEDKGLVKKEKEIILAEMELYKFNLEANILQESSNVEKITQKNKYKVTENGKNVIEFCRKYFGTCFDYSFTENMESRLDEIHEGTISKNDVCSNFVSELDRMISESQLLLKDTKTKAETNKSKRKNLGKHENNSIYLCHGQYGFYLEWKKKNYSVSITDSDIIDKMELSDFVSIIKEKEETKNENILRTINSDISIRKGPYGDYLHYQTNKMKKPKFIGLKKFPKEIDYLTCDDNMLSSFISSELSTNENSSGRKKRYFRKRQ